MDEVATSRRSITFNGPLEAGVRVVTVLGAAYPRTFDLHHLTALDYLLVRTKELDGPESIHPPTPIRSPNAEVRRRVVQQGLVLMMSRDLVARQATSLGIQYLAGESTAAFLDSLRSPYLMELKLRANWLVDYFKDQSEEAFAQTIRRFFDDWVVEFQEFERSFGSS
jgi:ABC-3C biological conflict system middle component